MSHGPTTRIDPTSNTARFHLLHGREDQFRQLIRLNVRLSKDMPAGGENSTREIRWIDAKRAIATRAIGQTLFFPNRSSLTDSVPSLVFTHRRSSAHDFPQSFQHRHQNRHGSDSNSTTATRHASTSTHRSLPHASIASSRPLSPDRFAREPPAHWTPGTSTFAELSVRWPTHVRCSAYSTATFRRRSIVVRCESTSAACSSLVCLAANWNAGRTYATI